MKKLIKISFLILLFSQGSNRGYAQDQESGEFEKYCKENIAFTNFRLLGINRNQYAKCVESVNYADPDKRHKLVTIDGVLFTDDGKNYDLVANDGTLTSNTLFTYARGEEILAAGEYRVVKNNMTIYDAGFLHQDKLNTTMKPSGWEISCKFKWVSCSSWPPALQQLCFDLSWPFRGGFEITECTVVYKQ